MRVKTQRQKPAGDETPGRYLETDSDRETKHELLLKADTSDPVGHTCATRDLFSYARNAYHSRSLTHETHVPIKRNLCTKP